MQPKSQQKKDKKSKRAEERKRQKDAKKQAEKKYIPGMMDRPIDPEEPSDSDLGMEVQQQEALQKLQEQQRKAISEQDQHTEKMQSHHQQQQQNQVRLAPWAMNSNVKPQQDTSEMTLAEIQALERERERANQVEREKRQKELMERQRAEEEDLRQRTNAGIWNKSKVETPSNRVKSLAEIQEEEARAERNRQERERQERVQRQKDITLSQASVWGNASANLSWGNKNKSNGGFWEDQPPVQQAQPVQQHQPQPLQQRQEQPPPQHQQQAPQQSRKAGKKKQKDEDKAFNVQEKKVQT